MCLASSWGLRVTISVTCTVYSRQRLNVLCSACGPADRIVTLAFSTAARGPTGPRTEAGRRIRAGRYQPACPRTTWNAHGEEQTGGHCTQRKSWQTPTLVKSAQAKAPSLAQLARLSDSSGAAASAMSVARGHKAAAVRPHLPARAHRSRILTAGSLAGLLLLLLAEPVRLAA